MKTIKSYVKSPATIFSLNNERRSIKNWLFLHLQAFFVIALCSGSLFARAGNFTKDDLAQARKTTMQICEQYGRMAKDIGYDRDRTMSAAYVRDQYARLSTPNVPLDTMIHRIFTDKEHIGLTPTALKTKIYKQCMAGDWDKYNEIIYSRQAYYNEARGFKPKAPVVQAPDPDANETRRLKPTAPVLQPTEADISESRRYRAK